MIQLRKLFTPVAALDAEEAKNYMAKQGEGTYTLLDVRQPWEYEADHLPGARLVPLAELSAGSKDLDPGKPTVVYCAVGGRSRVGAQLLSGMGFEEVYNLSGGIKAYGGHTASGPQEINLDLVRGDESPEEILKLAFAMEKALQSFYEVSREKTTDGALRELFDKLGHIEAVHKENLYRRYAALVPGAPDLAAFEAAVVPEVLEGGFRFKEFLAANQPWLKTAAQVLELALMLETQALDLYLRLAARCLEEETKKVLFTIADEEKFHLQSLGRLLDEKR